MMVVQVCNRVNWLYFHLATPYGLQSRTVPDPDASIFLPGPFSHPRASIMFMQVLKSSLLAPSYSPAYRPAQ